MSEILDGRSYLIDRTSENHKNHIFLSARDEDVPETHVPLFDLLSNPNNKGIHMGVLALQDIRKRTFQNVYELFDDCGSASFSDFYNQNLEELSALGLIFFENNTVLSQISHLIECFEKISENHADFSYISFGINREDLKEYLSLRGQKMELPDRLKRPKSHFLNLSDYEKMKSRFGYYYFQLSKRNNVSLCNCAITRRFQDWCNLNDIDFEKGILIAMEFLCSQSKESALKPLEKYDKVTRFDSLFLAKPEKDSELVKEEIQFDGYIHALAKSIIARMNRDPKNQFHPIDFQLYVNNALFAFNKSVPLKYRDPKLYMEYGDYDKMVEEARLIHKQKEDSYAKKQTE